MFYASLTAHFFRPRSDTPDVTTNTALNVALLVATFLNLFTTVCINLNITNIIREQKTFVKLGTTFDVRHSTFEMMTP